MEKYIDINRANYETYVIDYLDGKLNAVERRYFIAFLESNPDIKDDIESINEITIQPDKEVFPKKDNLKKVPVVDVDGINEGNYEEYFIANYENDLSASEKKSLALFLDKNQNLQQEFDIYSKLKLVPVGDIVFSAKAQLKHKVSLKPMWYSAAAAMIILFTAYWFLFDQQPSSINMKLASVSHVSPKEISSSLSSQVEAKLVSQKREISVIPVYDNDDLVEQNEKILLAYVESKSINTQFVDVYDYARIVESKNNNLSFVNESINNEDYASAETKDKTDRSLFASVLNAQFKKIGSRIGIGKKKQAQPGDPKYIEFFDKGLTVFNTITGSETATVKTYNVYGELTSYQVEGREVLFGRNQTRKLSQ